MNSFKLLILLALSTIYISFNSCTPDKNSTNNSSKPICGDDVCSIGEDYGNCPADCPVWTCGNAVKDTGEECDGPDLGGVSCESLGYSGGNLSCTYRCNLDPSECTGCPTACDPPGALQCSGNNIQMCAYEGECLKWINQEDCSLSGESCSDSDGTPQCSSSCSNECSEAGVSRCNGDIIETCTLSDSCLHWIAGTDCTTQNGICTVTGTVASCNTTTNNTNNNNCPMTPPHGGNSGGSGGTIMPSGEWQAASGVNYILVVPSSYNVSTPNRLMIVYSGTEGADAMRQNLTGGLAAYAGVGDVIFAILDGVTYNGNGQAGGTVLDDVRSKYNIDNDTTFLLSESAGTTAGLQLGFNLRQSYFAAYWANDVNASATPSQNASQLCFAPWGNAGPGGDYADANAIVNGMSSAGYQLPGDAPYSGSGSDSHGSSDQFIAAMQFFNGKSRQ